jgi:hypothetical protein
MNKLRDCVCLLVFVLGWSVWLAAAEQTSVRIVGLRIVKPEPGEERKSVVFGSWPGTALHVHIRRPDKYLIDLDEDASQLTTFTDDKETNLLRKGRGHFSKPGISSRLEEDGHGCVVELKSAFTPAPGATTVRAEATLVLLCGSDEKSAEQKGLELKAGNQITAGPVPLKIKEVGQEGWGKTKMTLELTASQDLSAIKEFAFAKPDGTKIEHQVTGKGKWGFAGQMEYMRTIGLHEKVDKVDVRVTYFSKVEKLTVPVKIATGVGF